MSYRQQKLQSLSIVCEREEKVLAAFLKHLLPRSCFSDKVMELVSHRILICSSQWLGRHDDSSGMAARNTLIQPLLQLFSSHAHPAACYPSAESSENNCWNISSFHCPRVLFEIKRNSVWMVVKIPHRRASIQKYHMDTSMFTSTVLEPPALLLLSLLVRAFFLLFFPSFSCLCVHFKIDFWVLY